MPLFPSQQRTRVMDPRERIAGDRPAKGASASTSASAAAAPAPGATATSLLRRYRPLQTRAAGGFGSVEICLDSRLQRRVAIKRMPLASPDAFAPAETVAQALTEARTASLLQHPHIVSVIDFTYDAAYAYLVMEYVDGMSLEEFLSAVDGHSLTYDEAAAVADALVQALSFAHENGVLHLDIKPANVLIDRNGHVKLTDFGMASLASAAGFGGARGGTIGYMAPEQLRGETVDERADVFSLAAVLYESLCATAPFRAATPADSEKRIERGVVFPSDLLPGIPQAAEEALLSALSPLPEARMASVPAFGDRFLSGLGDVREGRKSLARLIARLTSDDADAEEDEPAERAARVWELDPQKGYLGSRTDRARPLLHGAVTAVSVGWACWALLGSGGVTEPAGRLVVALAVGAASFAAPQIGSALLYCGLAATALMRTPLVPVLPVVAALAALACGWWLVWGRTDSGASASLALACALVGATGDAVLAAPVAAAAAGCMAWGTGSAVSAGLGALTGRLVSAAVAAGGRLDVGLAASALADPSLWVAAAGSALASAGLSAALSWAWNRCLDGRGTGAYLLAYLVPLVCGIAVACLAHPMEIASSTPLQAAMVAGAGAASSIIACIYVYLFGYRKERPESDCS